MLKNYTREFSYNLKLAYPIILGYVGHTLVAFVDNAMVGRLGAEPLAAVSLGNSIFFVAMSIGIGFSIAITPLVAEADGNNNPNKGRLAFQHGLIFCTVLGFILSIGSFLTTPILNHMGQDDKVVELTIPYLQIISISLFPMLIFQGFKQFADGISKTKISMYATLVANIVNVIVNYFLIYGIWIFPEMGVVGAGIGTLVSRIAMVILIYYFLKRDKSTIYYLVPLKLKELTKSIFIKISSLGFPSSIQMLCEVGLFVGCVWYLGTKGYLVQAANQIALNIASMTFMVSMGLSAAGTIRVGNQFGKRDFKELKRVAISIFILTFIIEIVFALILITLNGYIPLLYINNDEVIKIASALIIIAGFFQISDGLQVVFLGSLRGLQDVNIPTIITFVSYWIVGFGLCYFFGETLGYGATGVWYGLLSSLTFAGILLMWRFFYKVNLESKKY